jgi:hypothetical protein
MRLGPGDSLRNRMGSNLKRWRAQMTGIVLTSAGDQQGVLAVCLEGVAQALLDVVHDLQEWRVQVPCTTMLMHLLTIV